MHGSGWIDFLSGLGVLGKCETCPLTIRRRWKLRKQEIYKKGRLLIDIIQYTYISSRFFENQLNEICSHLREKASKGTFLEPKKLQNQSNEGKGKEKKKKRGEERRRREKSNRYTLSFYNSYFFWPKKTFGRKGLFDDNVIKNPARYIYTNIIGATFDIATFGQILASFGNVSQNLEYLVIRSSGCQYGI